MNPGLGEHGAEVAKEAVGSLKNYPALLTLVIINVIFMGAVAWATHERAVQAAEQFRVLVQQCGPKGG